MSRYTPTEVPLELIAGDQLALAAEHGQPVTIKVKVGGYRAMLPMTKAQIDKMKKGGKSIRLTPAHLSYLKKRGMAGRGIFGDVGKAVGPALGEAATTALSAIPGVGAIAGVAGPLIGEAITGITSAIGNEIDKSVEKRKYNEQQAAKNFNASTQKAKAFLGKSQADQMAEYQRMKAIPLVGKRIGTFDQYSKKMAQQAQQSSATPEGMLQKRLVKKGLVGGRPKGQKKRLTGVPASTPKAVNTLAAEYIKAALKGNI